MKNVLKLLSMFLGLQFLYSCWPTETCEEGMSYFIADNVGIVLSILDRDFGGFRTDYTGTSLKSGKIIRFKTNDTIYSRTRNYVDVGDTLIKNGGASSILLLKKDSVIVFKFYCENNFTQTKLQHFKRPLNESDLQIIEKLKNP